MKKGLIATVIVGLVLAVSLCVYTIVASIPTAPNYVPANYNFNLAFRTGETISEFEGYSVENGNLAFVPAEEPEDGADVEPQTDSVPAQQVITFDAETGAYTATSAGNAVVVLSDENGDTKTYNVTVFDHDAFGTDDSVPYVICNASHLMEFANIANNGSDDLASNKALDMDIEIVNDIDLAGEDWMPIGNCATPFTGSIEGNGYTISNMRISVTTENYTNYISKVKRPNNDINLGFFGKTDGAEILNLNFDSAYIFIDSKILPLIETYAFDTVPGFEALEAVVGSIAVGTVAGYMTRTTYTSTVAEQKVTITNTEISGFSYNGNDNAILPSGIGSVAGVMSESQISNAKISSKIFANSLIEEGSRVGGVVAYITAFDKNATSSETSVDFKSKIDNVEVISTINTRYYLGEVATSEEYKNYNSDRYNTVGLIAAHANNTEITNVVVKNSNILDYNGTIKNIDGNVLPDDNCLAVLSAGVAFADSVENELYNGNDDEFRFAMKNVEIANVLVTPAGKFGGVVAFAGANTTYVDCSVVDLSAHTAFAGGFAYQIYENATVSYTSDFAKEFAIDADLGGVRVAGFAVNMRGALEGIEVPAVDETPARKTTINVNITGYGSYIGDNYSAADRVIAAGFACYMYSTVADYTAIATNFDVIANINKSINIVGLVGIMGETTNPDHVAVGETKLDGINVNLNAFSYVNRKLALSTTRIVAGAVGQMFDGATINGVSANITLNNNVDTAENYGAAIFGGLVGHILGTNVVVTNNAVSGSATIVEGNFWARKLANSPETYYIQIAGGLVGLISNDDYADIAVADMDISLNSVSDMTINVIGDHAYAGTEENNGAIFFRIRGVGALVGNINHTSGTGNNLDLTTNTLENVVVSANKEAFTYIQKVDDQVTISYVLLGKDLSSSVGTTLEYIAQDGLVSITVPVTGFTYIDNAV